MQFDKQPTGAGLFRSPILYVVFDNNFTEQDFEYTFEVRLWIGDSLVPPVEPTYTLSRKPNATGNGLINVSRLMESELNYANIDRMLNTAMGFTDTSQAINCEVTASYISFVSVGTPVVSATHYAVRGYSIARDNSTNVVLPDGIFMAKGKLYGTRLSIMTIGIHNNNAGDVMDLQVKIHQDGGDFSAQDLPFLPDSTESDEKIVQYSLDVKEAATLIGNELPFELHLYSQTQATVVDIIEVIPIQECKYESKNVYWLNGLGAVQSTIFEKRSQAINTFEREVYKRRAISDLGVMDLEKGELKNFDSRQTVNEILHTGLRDQEDNFMLNDLLVSNYVVGLYEPEKTTFAMIPKNMTEEDRTSIFNKALIVWALSFEVSNDYINVIE